MSRVGGMGTLLGISMSTGCVELGFGMVARTVLFELGGRIVRVELVELSTSRRIWSWGRSILGQRVQPATTAVGDWLLAICLQQHHISSFSTDPFSLRKLTSRSIF